VNWLPSVRGLPRPFWYLLGGQLLNRLGGFVFPFLTLYLTGARGIPIERAGAIVSLYGLGAIAAGPIGGTLADRIGRRPSLLLALVAGAAATLHLGMARAEGHIAIAVLLVGLCNDLYRAPLQAMVIDLFPPGEQSRAFGLLYWINNLGFTFAAALGGLLANVDFSLLFVVDALTTLALGLVVLARVDETRPATPHAASTMAGALAPYRDGVMLRFVLLTFALGVAFTQLWLTLPVDMRAHGIAPRTFGALIAINGVVIITLQPATTELARRFHRSHVLALGAFVIGLGYGIGALTGGAAVYAAVMVVVTLGEILFMPIAPTVVADLAPGDRRGVYQGAYQLAWGGATFVAPALGSLVLGRLGARAVWLGCLGLGSLVALGQLAIAPARRRRLAAERTRAAAARSTLEDRSEHSRSGLGDTLD
jgi:MFS family permease